MTLPIVSADKSRIAPINALSGKKTWWRGPTSLLAIWGAIRPMKEIPPVTETAADAKATALKRRIHLSFSTRTPKPIAACSSTFKRFKACRRAKMIRKKRTSQGRKAKTKGQSTAGEFRFFFNDERRFDLSRRPLDRYSVTASPLPTDADLVEDLAWFPRSEEHVPDWYPRA